MKIEKTKNGALLTVKLEGKLDTVTAPELERAQKDELPAGGELVFDFSSLEYISSAGLRVLLSAQKSMTVTGGSMKVTGVNDLVNEVFEVTGFSEILTVE